MAIVDVVRSWETGYGVSADGRTATERYTVTTDAAVNDLSVIAEASGIPRVGVDAYAGDDWLRCVGVAPRSIGPRYFEVIVSYERQGDGDVATPLEADPEWRWDTAESTEPKDYDVLGNAITNTVGERLDPPMAFAVVDRVLLYSRNEASFDTHARAAWDNVTNSAAWLGWPKGTALCRPIKGVKKTHGALKYFRVSYRFEFRMGAGDSGTDKAWYRRVLNQGLRKSTDTVDANGAPIYAPIKDSEDNPITEPVLLDALGKPLGKGEPAVWIYVQQYKVKDLSALAIVLK